MANSWWDAPNTPYGTKTNITLQNGHPDYEKGGVTGERSNGKAAPDTTSHAANGATNGSNGNGG